MTILFGVVRGNTVVLPDDAGLPDGQTVEIRPIGAVSQNTTDDAAEEAFLHKLVEKGLLEDVKRPPRVPPAEDRSPIEVKGTPLSQMIIEERR
jgi:hypothetical protein